jgi:thiamine pyrophosphokinase
MKTIKEYLDVMKSSNEIALIGPLHNGDIITETAKIFVDGGSQFRNNNEGVSVGDNDSSVIPLDIVLNTKKDFSDLGYTLEHITENFEFINLYGFLGGRRDHELINYAEVGRFLESRSVETIVCFENKVKAFSSGKWEFKLEGTFSLFAFKPCNIKIIGACEYQIPELSPFSELSSFGLSNEASGAVTITSDGPIFIFIN